ncbi:TatD family hydrolase [Undibacterium sp. TS12]|uniref:TatD family hydrolase n=1 Tax=Undibacterium sp. TS12 TaxID=2908202 RepID=UPI001F4CF468|nr:TatD family hydrolase [Undibacterium sp. TS12]MCH8618895.1 TatD family hydrolase [Undibacterium sp. TS12]
MWIDSHCHLDANEFGGQSLSVAEEAAGAGVSAIIVPAVHKTNFEAVITLGQQREDCFYALGIHPMYVPTSKEEDLQLLRDRVAGLMAGADAGSKLVAIGEIGLDYFVPELTQSPLREKQEHFYIEQLKLARDFDLPVLLHVRRSQDIILKHLRHIQVNGGIAHAFNGSAQQAEVFIKLGFKLGFGGAMTFTRALQIRRLASDLPLDSIVLETDAPDIPPAWLDEEFNTPAQLPEIGRVLAELRNMSIADLAAATSANVRTVLPRMLIG